MAEEMKGSLEVLLRCEPSDLPMLYQHEVAGREWVVPGCLSSCHEWAASQVRLLWRQRSLWKGNRQSHLCPSLERPVPF